MTQRDCESCGLKMHKIGPFARTKGEGEPAAKSENYVEYQCINEACPEYLKFVRHPY